MAQIGERPPRFAIQVNSRTRVTRDYAYFLENRLRARYGMDGVPLIIDFVERGERGRGDGRSARRAESAQDCAHGRGPALKRQSAPVRLRLSRLSPDPDLEGRPWS